MAILLAIVITSYRQTIYAYPSGGGSYVVSRENLGAMINEYLNLSISPLSRIPLDVSFAPYGRLSRLAERLDRTIRGLIAARRAAGEGGSADMLSMLLAAVDDDGGRSSEDELVAHTTTLFIAGQETSANGLAWTLFLLAQQRELHCRWRGGELLERCPHAS